MMSAPSWLQRRLIAFSRVVVASAQPSRKSGSFRLSVQELENRAVPSAALVRDINVNTAGSFPGSLVNVNGHVYFSAVDNAGNAALYTSLGTAANTVLIKEFPSSGFDAPYLTNLTNVNGTVFFYVGRSQFGGPSELWLTDGTTGGTRLVRDFGGDAFANPNGSPVVISFDGSAYFLIEHRTAPAARQLWTSDGTTTTQIAPGAFSVNSFFPGLTVVGDTLYFAASDPVNGTKLWRTDGTDSGTEIADADVPARGALALTAIGDDLYFFATSDATPEMKNLYKFDGAATTMVQTGFSNFSNLEGADVDGRLFFSAATTDAPFADQLWVSDGTGPGTIMVHPFHAYSQGLRPFYLTSFNGQLLFNGFDDAGHFQPVWVSDGTDAGTQILFPNTDAFARLAPTNVALTNDIVYFGAQGFHSNQELWQTDGTAAGTTRIADFGTTGASSFAPSGLTISNGTLFLSATDKAHGAEPWTSDGTTDGTKLVTDINTNTVSGFINSGFPTYLVNANGELFFNADNGQGPPSILSSQIWKSDGTTAGTELVAMPFPVSPSNLLDGPINLTNVGNNVFFSPLNAPQLWVTNGTPAGTRMLKDFSDSNSFGNTLFNFTAVGDELFFTAYDPTSPIGAQQLWKSDGTPAGTVLVADNLIVSYGASVAVADTLYFAAINLITYNWQLWRSDGTAAGTHVVDAIHPGTGVRKLTNVNGTLYYFDAEASNGFSVWKTDGTFNTRVADVHPGDDYWFEYNPIAVNGKLSFAALNWSTGEGELWKSNGSTKGTVAVTAVRADFGSVVANGKQLFFTVTNPNDGSQKLWVSDGTAAGTKAVAPVVGGTDVFGDPLPFDLTAFKGIVYFAASDPDHGRELWQSDGTAAGTFMTQDINPGRAGSSPESLTVAGSRLYLTADDRAHGRELWVFKQTGHAAAQDTRSHARQAGTTVGAPVSPQLATPFFIVPGPMGAYNTRVRETKPPTAIRGLQATQQFVADGPHAIRLEILHSPNLLVELDTIAAVG